jgi:hypothetical protein
VAPVTLAFGGGGTVFLNARWQVSVNGVYRLPWQLELAGNLVGRQGTPSPYMIPQRLGLDGTRSVLVTPRVDSVRLDDLWNLDLRLAKHVRQGKVSTDIIADVFNVLNSNAVLVRERNLRSANFNAVRMTVSPRIRRASGFLRHERFLDKEAGMVCHSLRLVALAAALVVSAACQDRTPTSPHQMQAAPLPPTTFPEVVKPARILVFSPSPLYRASAYTIDSRYVLYDDGEFALQYLRSLGSWSYSGTYKEADGKLTFTFNGRGWSVPGQPDARGVLDGDTLTVSYNIVMQMSDFEDGMYVRTR